MNKPENQFAIARMKNAALLLIGILSFATQGSTSCFAQDANNRSTDVELARPNVVLIMADDLGWGDTGYYGHPVLKTPSLDQMAAEGIRFDRFYAAAPVCSPTRGSMLTGRHPYRYQIKGANNGHLKSPESTLAEMLKGAGYATGHFGKWHLGTMSKSVKDSNRGGKGPENYAPPWDHGFETCFSTEAKTPTWWKAGDYQSYNTRYWTGPQQPVEAKSILGDDSRLIVDAANTFIENAVNEEQNFLTVVWFHAPHKPYVAGPKYLEQYKPYVDSNRKKGKRFAESDADYYGCISALDEQVGELRKKLKQLNVADNTIVLFCSDNGPERNTPGGAQADLNGAGGADAIQLRARKRSLYEGGIRVPGLLVWPAKFKKPMVHSGPCVTSDIFPTILKATQTTEGTVKPIDGTNLLPILEGDIEEREEPIYFQAGTQKAMIGNRYKLIKAGNNSEWQLYDLQSDPGETTDIAASQSTLVRSMEDKFSAFSESCERSASGNDY